MKTITIQKLKQESRGITGLATEIRARIDGGHYDFMSWKGRSQLKDKVDEYERYANEPYRSSNGMADRDIRQRKIMTELRALLNSTY
jgi:hypothetical protein